MSSYSSIVVVARMDWKTSLNLLPAMGRNPQNTIVIQDIESPKELLAGLKNEILDSIMKQGVEELFVIGLANTNTTQDIVERIESLAEFKQIQGRIPIHGLLLEPDTYKLDVVHRDY